MKIKDIIEIEKTILIEVCRGVVENVYNLPNNYNYEIIENDNYDYIEDVKKQRASEQRG